jgi:hypothetical protein
MAPARFAKFIVLFFIDLVERKVEAAGAAQAANGLWMSQIVRNLTNSGDGILVGKRYLTHDRDPLFTAEFLSTITSIGVKSVKLPSRVPNLNAHAERFMCSVKEACLNGVIFFGEASLRTAIQNFVAHYHSERNHQGPGEPTHPSSSRPPRKHRRDPATAAPAELLLP